MTIDAIGADVALERVDRLAVALGRVRRLELHHVEVGEVRVERGALPLGVDQADLALSARHQPLRERSAE
jgi:hypothetical protein